MERAARVPLAGFHSLDELVTMAARGERLPGGCDPGSLLLSLNDAAPDGPCEAASCGEEWEFTAFARDGSSMLVCCDHADEFMKADPAACKWERFSGRWRAD